MEGHMHSIIEKLSDIENTAEAIVEHAEAQKYEIEKKIQAKRDQFDKDLEARTQKRLDEIRAEAEAKMDQILEEQREKNRSTIDNLRKEYEENHSAYAQEILKHIIEV